ncbi:MAG: hypothetical protein H0T42_23015 [Deltaproteobacteria bacterium]|nr:hypothetical protein [Deltaproteobacteria bacterium]
MSRLTATVLAATLLSLAPAKAEAFDWNGKTSLAEFDFGNFETDSGHPLATFRAFAIAHAAPGAYAFLARVLGPGFEDDESVPLQAVIYGSWLNEINTNLDGDGFSMRVLAQLLAARYSAYLDGRTHSEDYTAATGYSSSNYTHSMMVTSTTRSISQNEIFDRIQQYIHSSTTDAILELIIATKAKEQGTLSASEIARHRTAGLHSIGSVFHIIEDSSVTCSAGARAKVSCIPGDGHVVTGNTSAGTRVVTLSDNNFYERVDEHGDHPHEALDALYRPENISSVYGDRDPALTTSRYLVDIVRSVSEALDQTRSMPLVVNGALNPQFMQVAAATASSAAGTISSNVVDSRYAKQGERKAMPACTVGCDGKADGEDIAVEEEAEVEGGCSTTQPVGLALLTLLGLALIPARRRRKV